MDGLPHTSGKLGECTMMHGKARCVPRRIHYVHLQVHTREYQQHLADVRRKRMRPYNRPLLLEQLTKEMLNVLDVLPFMQKLLSTL